MSLINYDPFFPIRSHFNRTSRDPWNLIDTFFDNSFQPQLRDHAGRLSIETSGNFSYKVDISGFLPEEVKVEVEGDDVIIRGNHNAENEQETVERSFIRRFHIPNGISKETISCSINEKGHLVIIGQKTSNIQSEKRSIPINIKPTLNNK